MASPIWQQIQRTLHSEIADGRFTPGDKLPTEAALAQRFGVNRHTVRRALAELSDEGLVHARRGSGVFVRAAPVSYRVGRRSRFSQNLKAAGLSGAREILRLDTAQASRADAEALTLKKGDPIHILESVGLIDDAPALFGLSLFPAAGLDEFPDALRQTGSITAALQACGIGNYRRAWTRLTAERATGNTARHLRISEGAPIIRAKSLNLTDDARPIEYAHTSFCADRVELLIEEGA
ncbi:MAG: phosphonate metabolism transcriptional regulator PhnF [Pseudomonadota bacterium]